MKSCDGKRGRLRIGRNPPPEKGAFAPAERNHKFTEVAALQPREQVRPVVAPSEMIGDYVKRKLVPIPDTAEAKKLWTMIDPWVYREKLTLPKMLIHGTNDHWTSARWSRDYVERSRSIALSATWTALPGVGHFMVRRVKAWNEFVKTSILAILGEARPAPGQPTSSEGRA